VEWFRDLYDDFRRKRMFEHISDEDTRREVDFIYDVLNLYEGAKVLDLFCATGRHSIELAARGCQTTGVDFNPDYLRFARKRAKDKGVSPEFILGDVRQVDFGKGYDGAIIMLCSFGYFNDKENKKVLEKVYCALKEGSRFLIEILSRDWILKNFIERNEIMVNGIKIIEQRKFDIGSNRNNFTIKRYTKDGIIMKKGSWRFYSACEMNNILESIGFKFVAGYDNLNKDPFTKDTRLMRLVFEK